MRVRSLFSNKKPFNFIQRWISRLIWGRWGLGFLFWESTGDLPYIPWRTLSETVWDVEKEYPGTADDIFGLLLGLSVHLRWKVEIFDALDWGLSRTDLSQIFLQEVEAYLANVKTKTEAAI